MENKVTNKILMVLIGVLLWVPFGFAKDIYVAQDSAGAINGGDCANTYSAAWFNSGSNWGSAATQINPGDTVHLCGTFTGAAGSTMLTVQGSGAAGQPITILFEANAILAAPYWSYATGAISCNNHAHITIDGGSNGLIKNTADGTGLSYQQNTLAINGGGAQCTNFTVENLHILNMYIRAAQSASDMADSIAIQFYGSNALAKNNIIDHVRDAVHVIYTSTSNIEIASNQMTFVETGSTIGDSNTNDTLNGLRVHDNDIGGGAYLWDTPSNSFHHDPIHIFCAHTGSTAVNLQIYNNYVHGIWGQDQAYFNSNGGSHMTAVFFIENAGPIQIFNNVIALTGKLNQPADGFIYLKSGQSSNAKIFNNILVDDNEGMGIAFAGSTGHDIRNNIMSGVAYAIYTPPGSSVAASDYNVFYQTVSFGNFNTFASWRGSGFDSHSVVGDPRLDANYAPQSGSSAIGMGVNLTPLGIASLNADLHGAIRPPSGAWEAGAYVNGGTQAAHPPAAPSGLSAIVQ
jgi:hypothetical protein